MSFELEFNLGRELSSEITEVRNEPGELQCGVINRRSAAYYLSIGARCLDNLVAQGKLKRVVLNPGRFGFRQQVLD